MYCTNCGSEVREGYFCVHCGTRAGAQAGSVITVPLTDVQRLKKAFSSKLFLAVAILLSVNVGFAVFVSVIIPLYFATLPIDYASIVGGVLFVVLALILMLPIIEMVGFWKVYRGNMGNGPVDASGPRLLAWVRRISYVLSWIGVGIMLAVGVISAVAVICGAADGYEHPEYNNAVLLLISVVIIIVSAVIAVFLVLYDRKIVKFAKDLAISAETGVINVGNVKSLHIWMLVMGIINAATGISGGVTVLIPAAVQICGSFWIKENFLKDE